MNEWLKESSYLWTILLLLPLWLLVFFQRKDLRRKLWHVGRALGIASVIVGQIFANDYWNPPYILGPYFPIEDFLYGIIYAGLITVLYQYIFGITYASKTLNTSKRTTLIFASISFIILLFLIKCCSLNSIYGQILLLITIGTYTIYKRADLFKPILITAILTTILTFLWLSLVFIIYPNGVIDNWKTSALSHIEILKVPLEELIFAFSIGFGSSFFYELSNGKFLNRN